MGTVIARAVPRTAATTRPPALDASAIVALRIGILMLALLAAAPAIGLRRSLMLIGLAALVLAVAGLRHPRLGLFGVGILCAVDPMMQSFVLTGGLLRWNTFNYFLLLVAALFIPSLVRRRGAPMRLLQATLLLLVLELMVSHDRPRGMQDLLGITAILGILTYVGRPGLRRADWYWLAIVVGAISAVGGAIFFRQQASLPEINPNAWAVFPVSAVLLCCLAVPFAAGHRHGTALLAVLTGVSCAWVFLSGSRGNMLVALTGVAYLFISLRTFGRRLTLAGIGALIVLAAAVQFSDLQARAVTRVSVLFSHDATLNDRTSHRSELVLAGWYLFLDHPLGVGTGGFTNAWERLGRRDGLAAVDNYRRMSAHAGWIKVLAENGAPGALLLAGFASSFALVGLRSRRRRPFLLGCLVSAVIGISLISTEYQNKALWFLAAAGIVMLGPDSLLQPARTRRTA